MKSVNTFANDLEYKEALHKMNEYEKARESWCVADGQNLKRMTSIPIEVSKTLPYADEVTNELRSKVEVYEFIQDKPEKYFLYINEENKTATTWTGEFLGNVSFGREYGNNMGDKRQNIDVHSINGNKYHGTYFKSAGNYARITKYKNQLN